MLFFRGAPQVGWARPGTGERGAAKGNPTLGQVFNPIFFTPTTNAVTSSLD